MNAQNHDGSNNQKQNRPAPKKAYIRPKLLFYGDVGQLTQTTGTMGNMDSPAGSTRTSLT
jgi:hypothetical protein